MNQSLDENVDVKNAWLALSAFWLDSLRPPFVLEVLKFFERTVYTIDRIEVP